MKKHLLLLCAVLGLAACSQEKAPVSLDPVAFHQGDECHVCGMVIDEWPGPKAEIIDGKNGEVKRFCSTTDMLTWYLQPENKHFQGAVYVHDMSKAHWDKPEDQYLIPANTAFYVLGSQKMGMGATLASFATLAAAERFAQEQGGRVLSFTQITLETLSEVARLSIPAENTPSSPAHGH